LGVIDSQWTKTALVEVAIANQFPFRVLEVESNSGRQQQTYYARLDCQTASELVGGWGVGRRGNLENRKTKSEKRNEEKNREAN
jgi:hypothetical protein